MRYSYSGLVLEEAGIAGGLHAPSVQLLHYELGERKGQHAIRFAAYDQDGRLEQCPLIVNEREVSRLKAEIARSPRLQGAAAPPRRRLASANSASRGSAP